MNAKTFIEYKSRLDESYVFLRLNGADKKLDDTSMQKSYFSDIFIHYASGAALSGSEPNAFTETVLNSQEIGTVVEELVASHMSQIKESEPMRAYNTYLRFLHSTHEIDFVFKRNNGSHIGIEVEYQGSVSQKNDIYRTKNITEYLLLSKDSMEKGRNFAVIPVQVLLALLKKSERDL